MSIRAVHLNVRTGSRLYSLKGGDAYSALTPKLLQNIACLPGHLRDELNIISSVVQVPTEPLKAALQRIGPNSPTICGLYVKDNPSINFYQAIQLFTKHLEAQKAILGVNLDVAADSGGETWPGAPIQLNFFRLIYEGGEKIVDKPTIHVDLENMLLDGIATCD